MSTTSDGGQILDGAGNRVWYCGSVYETDALNLYTEVSSVYPPPSSSSPSYDTDGNLQSHAGRDFVWDGENRLIKVTGPLYSVTNRYDHQHRRRQKTVSLWTGSAWQVQYTDTFVYDGWNPVCQVRVGVSGVVTNHYLWGLDLAGQRGGTRTVASALGGTAASPSAGGIGGLLAIRVEGQGAPRIYLPVSDQVGSIRSVISAATLATVAWFSYGTYGDVTASWYADSQVRADLECASIRFMSKFQDLETDPAYAGPGTSFKNAGVVYYGYRHLNPITGKWTCRDPLGEPGGSNLTGGRGVGPYELETPTIPSSCRSFRHLDRLPTSYMSRWVRRTKTETFRFLSDQPRGQMSTAAVSSPNQRYSSCTRRWGPANSEQEVIPGICTSFRYLDSFRPSIGFKIVHGGGGSPVAWTSAQHTEHRRVTTQEERTACSCDPRTLRVVSPMDSPTSCRPFCFHAAGLPRRLQTGKVANYRTLTYSIVTAQNYMSVARFAEKKRKRFRFLVRSGSQCSV